MEFDRYSIVLLRLRTDGPKRDEQAENTLQDAHLAFLSNLHDQGVVLAAGPLLGEPNRELRGLSVLNVPPETAHELHQTDPAVRGGRYTVEIVPWLVPKGVMSFTHGHLPRSLKEAAG